MPNTTTSSSPFCSQENETEFKLKALTAEMLVAPDADLLFNMTRCQQLSILLNLLLKGASPETVERLNQDCLAHWRKVSE